MDRPALMSSGSKPRLRYYWNYLNRVRKESAFKRVLDGNDVALVAPDFAGAPLRYELPFVGPDVLANAEDCGPYVPIGGPGFYVDGNTRRSTFALYRLGDDEGTVRGMFAGPGAVADVTLAPGDRFDGIVYVTINFMFDFEVDTPIVRQAAFDKIIALCVAENEMTHRRTFLTRFYIEPVPPAPAPNQRPFMRRIAIGIVPRIDYWGRHPKGAPPARTDQDCFIRIVRSRSEPHPFLWPVPPLEPKLMDDEVSVALLCYALGAPTFDEDPATRARTLRTALRASDFNGLAGVVSLALKDVPPQRRVVRAAP